MIKLYKTIITKVYEDATGENKTILDLYRRQLNEYHDKVSKGRDLQLKGDLDASDYREIKHDYERKVSIIEGKMLEMSSKKKDGIGPLLDRALTNVSRLPQLYQSADSEGKRRIISSMYPENLTFDGEQHRTTRVNEAIRVFDSVRAVFEVKNKGKSTTKVDLPSKVAGSRIELPTSGL